MTPPSAIPYRKLPGRRRGLIRGASLWAGPDHLLLVQSFRFREEYKRFYYRDVQAVAIAQAPRFHISTRALLIGFIVWVMAGLVSLRFHATGAAVVGLAFLALVLLWIYVSWKASCRCRIYTAVSSDEIPSVYRRSTARKFMAAVDPLVTAAQGALEGPWAELAEQRGVGPETSRVAAAQALKTEGAAPPRTLFSDLLIAALLLDAGLHFFPPAWLGLFRWSSAAAGLSLVAGAIGVMVQRQKGKIKAAMQKLAIAAMVALGVSFYAQAVGAGLIAGIAAGKNAGRPGAPVATISLADPDVPAIREIRAGLEALLGLLGIVLSIGARPSPQRGLLE